MSAKYGTYCEYVYLAYIVAIVIRFSYKLRYIIFRKTVFVVYFR